MPAAGPFPSLSLSVLISKMGVRRLGLASGNFPFTYSHVASGQSWKTVRGTTPCSSPSGGLSPKEKRRLEPRPRGGCGSSVSAISGRCQTNLNLQLETFGEQAGQGKHGAWKKPRWGGQRTHCVFLALSSPVTLTHPFLCVPQSPFCSMT